MHRYIGYGVGIALIILVPLTWKDPYIHHLLIMLNIYVILTVGLRMLLRTGIVSFAHVAAFAIGAYTSALLSTKAGLSWWLAMPVSALMTGILFMAIGYIILRVSGMFFVILSLALAEVVRLTFVFTPWLGGITGILNIPRPAVSIPGLVSIKFTSELHYYYLVMVLAAITVLIFYRLGKSRFGMALASIDQSEQLSESIGIDCLKYKVFLLSGASFFAGLAGSLYASYLTFINPQFFTFWESVWMLTFTVIGGTGSIAGPIVGSAMWVFLPEVLRDLAEFQNLALGIFLLVVIFLLPKGIISLSYLVPAWIAKAYQKGKGVAWRHTGVNSGG